MPKNNKKENNFEKYLIQGEFINPEVLEKYKQEAKKKNESLQSILIHKNILKDPQIGEIVADLNDWQFINLRDEKINKDLMRRIPQNVVKRQKLLAFKSDKNELWVAMANPENKKLLHYLKKIFAGATIKALYATEVDILDKLKLYDKKIGDSLNSLIQSQSKEADSATVEDSAIVKILNLIINNGYEKAASDIHFDPQEDFTQVRFRLDGILQDVVVIPRNLHDFIITRIKILSKLRTDEHLVPQDGKIRFEYNAEMVDIRVSIAPTTKGENAVLRLLAESSRRYNLQDLGLSKDVLKIVRDNIRKPWGMILATGPTGSGKTTSLYAILKILNIPGVNIATIEDPAEYNIDGITQIQVNKKTELTFANGLRSLLRQDPDIIMVGEIRDSETAKIAVNSAMTGHLVLSTLHTNDAATTLPRLLDMGIEPFLVSSTVNIAIAQRLVRKICPHCISTKSLKRKDFKDKIPEEVFNLFFKDKDEITAFEGQGCFVCKHTGYHGRIGVYEVLEVTEDIKSLIMANADAKTIKTKAVENGMSTILQDAIEKALQGKTTIEEVIRVIKE